MRVSVGRIMPARGIHDEKLNLILHSKSGIFSRAAEMQARCGVCGSDTRVSATAVAQRHHGCGPTLQGSEMDETHPLSLVPELGWHHWTGR